MSEKNDPLEMLRRLREVDALFHRELANLASGIGLEERIRRSSWPGADKMSEPEHVELVALLVAPRVAAELATDQSEEQFERAVGFTVVHNYEVARTLLKDAGYDV